MTTKALTRTGSLLGRPVFNFLNLVSICDHGPYSREYFAMQMLTTHKREFELLINSLETPEQQSLPAFTTMAEHMFPRHSWHELVEVNRTMQMMYLWVLIVAGRYDLFTECQKEESRLSLESFEELQGMVKKYLSNDPFAFIDIIQRLKIVMAGMAIHDLGKKRGLVSDILRSVGVDVQDFEDHDSLLKKLIAKAPEKISLLFSSMSHSENALLAKFFNIDLVLAQVAQGETTGAHLEHSGITLLDEPTRFMWYMKELLDVAGAAGQTVQNGSATLTEQTWRGFKHTIDAVEDYAMGTQTPTSAIAGLWIARTHLSIRLRLPYDKANGIAYSLGRLAMMLRIQSAEEVEELYHFIQSDNLGANRDEATELRVQLFKSLSENGQKGIALLTYYSPALFANVTKQLGSYKVGITLFARILIKVSDYFSKNGHGSSRATLFLEDVAREAAANISSVLTKKIILTKTIHGEINVSLE